MDFKEYPSYKNSGVEWLGDVPEHWEVIPSKFYFIERKEKAESSDKQLTASQKHGIIFQEDFMAENGRVMVVMKNPEILKKVRPNDFVISMRSFQGGLELSYLEGSISSAYVMLKPNLNVVDIEYFKYLFKTPRYIQSLQSTSNLIRDGQALRFNNFSQVKLVLPPKADQQKIVAFLDTETTRIDNLIAKQEKLIELLEEQRKSIISHAVTKGLNPNAPMKDSGVEWLGEVPEHWTVLKNRHIFNFSKGLSITKENLQENGVPCVSYGEVHSKFGFEFNPEINDMKFVSEEYLETSKNCLLNSGDFIFADTSEDFEGSGNFSYLNSNSQVFAGYHTVIARLKSKQKPRFFAYIFDSNAHRKQIQTQVKGIKVFSITQGILKDIYSWLPPVHEQDLIVEYLDNECKKISLLKAKQIELIEKLKEYRSSIISHAVTGKIDIREFC